MAMTGEQIYQNFAGRSSESLLSAAIRVTEIAQAYEGIAGRFAAVQQRMMGSWTGGAAESAHAGAAPLESALRTSAAQLDKYGSAHGDQGTAFDTAARDVQPMPEKPGIPNPLEFAKMVVTGGPQAVNDHLAKVEAYQAAAQHNEQVMAQYAAATSANQNIPTEYPRPVENGGTVTKEGVEHDNPMSATETGEKEKEPGDDDGGTVTSSGGGGPLSGTGPGVGGVGVGGVGAAGIGGTGGTGPAGIDPALTSTGKTGGGPTPAPVGANGSFGPVQRQPKQESEIPDCGVPTLPPGLGDSDDSTDTTTDLTDLDDPSDTTTTSVVGPAIGGTADWRGESPGRYTGDAWSVGGGDGSARGGGQAGAGGGAGGVLGGVGGPGGAGGSAAGLAGAARGARGAGGFGAAVPPGSRREDDKEHTRLEFLIEPDPNAVFGTDEPSSTPVIGETWKPE